MELHNTVREFITNLLPERAQTFLNAGGWWLIVGLLSFMILFVLWSYLGRIVSRLAGRRGPVDESKLVEHLGSYPALQRPASSSRLVVEGISARIQLVVLAPVGQGTTLTPAIFVPVLEGLVHGLGKQLEEDRPKLRVWPPQLSHQGFAMTFHRLVKKAEGEGKPSPWILIAGSTPPGRKAVMVGLALRTDELVSLGRLTLNPNDWASTLRVKTAHG